MAVVGMTDHKTRITPAQRRALTMLLNGGAFIRHAYADFYWAYFGQPRDVMNAVANPTICVLRERKLIEDRPIPVGVSDRAEYIISEAGRRALT
jgi:hypothetical protein